MLAREDGIRHLIFGFLLALLIAGALSAISGSGSAGGQAPSPSTNAPDEMQRFALRFFDRTAGEETFLVGSGERASVLEIPAHVRADLPGRSVTMDQKLQVDASTHALRQYELTAIVAGATQTIRCERKGDSILVSITTPTGSIRRGFAETRPVYVLDNLLVNHLALLAETLHERGFPAETLRVVVPQVGAVIDAVVVPKPLEPGAATQADSAAVRDVDLQLGGVTETMRIDARGRLLEMRVPSQGIAYTRIGPGSEIAVTPPGDGARGVVPPSGGSTGPGAIPEGTAPNATPLFLEQPVRIPAGGEIELDGVLTFPQGGQPIPYAGIVLVQGSGPLDRDETVGPNRPFLDLARGLAVQGIATLRFDKRTLAAPQTFDPVKGTVKEEVIDDAVAALQFLRYQPEIDGRRIFLLGHSLGGGLAATIAREDRRVAGLVILAGTLRPLDEVLRDQIAYLNRLAAEQGTLSAEQERMQRDLDARLDSLAAGQLRPDARVYGMSAHYLQDYRSRDLEGDFLAFPGPVLILQGGKDYQVTADKDLALWKSVVGASGKKNVTIREFPNLGHLFMPIEGVPSPAAYQVPGHVDPGVIEAISTFVEEARRAGQSRRDR